MKSSANTWLQVVKVSVCPPPSSYSFLAQAGGGFHVEDVSAVKSHPYWLTVFKPSAETLCNVG